MPQTPNTRVKNDSTGRCIIFASHKGSEMARFENGAAKLNHALIRELSIAPAATQRN